MKSFVLAIDQGTTGTTVVILDEELSLLAKVTREFPQIYPCSGWVEHDPEEIWRSTVQAVRGAMELSGVGGADIAAIGITNQRETTLLWERANGRPVHNAIVWQCRRTADWCQELKLAGREDLVRQRTGLVLDPYFSATKVGWMLDHVGGARVQACRGELAFGTVDSYLIWRLTGGLAHVTDASNASRTLLMNIQTLRWDPDLLELFRVPVEVLPEIRGCSEVLGVTRGLFEEMGLPDGVPVAGVAGDQQAALFGQACFEPTMAKCTYGTGAFLLVNMGERMVLSNNGLLTTVAWKLGNRVTYAMEGSIFIAGAAVQWLRDGLGLIRSSAEVEGLAREVEDSEGVMFIPALAGLGAPHWRPLARGAIVGLHRGTRPAHIARATLEGVAQQVADLVDAMAQDLGLALVMEPDVDHQRVRVAHATKAGNIVGAMGLEGVWDEIQGARVGLPPFTGVRAPDVQVNLRPPISSLRVDGGAASNDLLCQIQADLLGVEIVRPAIVETTALGAAFLAGLAVGVWPDQRALQRAWKEGGRFRPAMARGRAAELRARWRGAVAGI